MWTPRRRPEPDHLNRYWNALNRGAPPEELARLAEPLDPTVIAAIDRARALHRRRRPDPAFATRLEQDLMHAFATAPAGSVPLRPISPKPMNGRSAPRGRWAWLPALPVSKDRRRWAIAQLATALLILVTLLAVYFAFRPEENHGIVGPGGTATPIPAPVLPSVPMFRGNPARTGVMPGPGPQEPVGILWRSPLLETGDRVWSSPAVANGLVYVGTATFIGSPAGALHALDAASGQERWRFDTEGFSMSASPAVVDGVVYAAADNSYTGFAYALDAQTGQERWRTEIGPDRTWDGPIVADGLVHLCTESAVVTLDAATGAERWSLPLTPLLCRNLAVADGVLYVPTLSDIERSGDLLALDPETGQERWRLHFEDGLFSIAVVDGVAYLGLADFSTDRFSGGVAAVDLTTRTQLWRYDDPDGRGHGSPTVAGGVVYVGDSSPVRPGILHALDATTGTVRWTASLDDMLYSSPAVVDGVVYLGSGNIYSDPARFTPGIIHAVDAATGTERWRLVLAERGGIVSSPAVVGGVLYVGCDDGHVYALGHVGAAAGTATPAAE
jgi:eukaryotic-like serine/threonine-protein kinase